MSDDLYAVVTNDLRIYCERCAAKRYPERVYPDDVTPVFESDEWRYEVAGACVDCEHFVGPR